MKIKIETIKKISILFSFPFALLINTYVMYGIIKQSNIL